MRIANARQGSRIEPVYGDAANEDGPAHPLDSNESIQKFSRLRGYIQFERDYQAENRILMARDEAYYDHDQLTAEEKAILDARGQSDAATNIIKPIVDWMVGTERRMRFDTNVLPRGKEDAAQAEQKSKLLKYLQDANRSQFERSSAFSEATKAGLSWVEVGVRPDFDDGERLLNRFVSWRNVYHDSMSRRNDLEDARYVVRFRYVDLDIAEKYFPERAAVLGRAAGYLGDRRFQYDEDDIYYMGEQINGRPLASGYRSSLNGMQTGWMERKQVKLYEVWYREVQMCDVITQGPWNGCVLMNTDGPLMYLVEENGWKVERRLKMRIRVAIMTDFDLLMDTDSPYRHNRFPYVPMWCYRKASTGLPYGIVRGIIGEQDTFNKMNAKAIHALSTKRVVYEKGALGPAQSNELPTEVARPDAIIELEAGGLGKFRVESDHAVASQAVEMARIHETLARNSSGVTQENLGRGPNSQSGKALLVKSEQGGLVTAEVFDNQLLHSQLVGEIELTNIEQFYTQRKVIRLLGERDAANFTVINGGEEDSDESADPITASRADFIIAERDSRASMRQAQFEAFGDIIGKVAPYAPDVTRALLDVLVDMSDMPLRETAVKRIRQVTGQRDENEKLSPEEQAQIDANQQKAEMADRLKMETAMAQLRKINAEADSMDARTLKDSLMAVFTSLESGAVLNSAPQVGQTAAAIMASVDKPGGADPIAVPASPEQPTSAGYVPVDMLKTPTR
jgi:hypothetical protein